MCVEGGGFKNQQPCGRERGFSGFTVHIFCKVGLWGLGQLQTFPQLSLNNNGFVLKTLPSPPQFLHFQINLGDFSSDIHTSSKL